MALTQKIILNIFVTLPLLFFLWGQINHVYVNGLSLAVQSLYRLYRAMGYMNYSLDCHDLSWGSVVFFSLCSTRFEFIRGDFTLDMTGLSITLITFIFLAICSIERPLRTWVIKTCLGTGFLTAFHLFYLLVVGLSFLWFPLTGQSFFRRLLMLMSGVLPLFLWILIFQLKNLSSRLSFPQTGGKR